MTKEQLKKRVAKFQEETTTNKIGEAEMFARRKMAQFLIMERKYTEHIIMNGLEAKVKINMEIELSEKGG